MCMYCLLSIKIDNIDKKLLFVLFCLVLLESYKMHTKIMKRTIAKY